MNVNFKKPAAIHQIPEETRLRNALIDQFNINEKLVKENRVLRDRIKEFEGWKDVLQSTRSSPNPFAATLNQGSRAAAAESNISRVPGDDGLTS